MVLKPSKFISEIKESVLHLFFPQICAGCNSNLLSKDNMLCLYCHSSLPQTSFHLHANNPIEKLFWGRLPVTHATALHSIKTKETPRYVTKDQELNRVLGGGIVPGSIILIAGEPGIGKSTLFLQMGLQLSDLTVLYISGEESENK